MPIVPLRNDDGHGWDDQLFRHARLRAAIVRQHAQPRQQRRDPDAQLRFAICPALIGRLGFNIDGDRLVPSPFHRHVVPTLDMRRG